MVNSLDSPTDIGQINFVSPWPSSSICSSSNVSPQLQFQLQLILLIPCRKHFVG